MPEWTTVARTGEMTGGEMTGGTVAGEEVLVVNLGRQYRAVSATCRTQAARWSTTGKLTRAL